MVQIRRVVREGLLAEVISISGGIVAGLGLALMRGTLEEVAGMLVMIPAFLQMRGDISGSLGSRMGTALHMGIVKAEYRWSKDLVQNIYGSMALGLVEAALIGVFAHFVCLMLGFPSTGIEKLTSISLIAGVLSQSLMVFLTIISAIFFYRRGLDPDTMMGPYVTTIGDAISISCLFIAAKIVSWGL